MRSAVNVRTGRPLTFAVKAGILIHQVHSPTKTPKSPLPWPSFVFALLLAFFLLLRLVRIIGHGCFLGIWLADDLFNAVITIPPVSSVLFSFSLSLLLPLPLPLPFAYFLLYSAGVSAKAPFFQIPLFAFLKRIQRRISTKSQ